MKLQNTTGSIQTVQIDLVAVPLAPNQIATFDDTPRGLQDAQRLVDQGVVAFVATEAGSNAVGSVDVPRSRLLHVTGAITDGMFVTIKGIEFEFDDDDTVTEGRTKVDLGASVREALINLGIAVAANETLASQANRIVPRGVLTVTADANEYALFESLTGVDMELDESGGPLCWTPEVLPVDVPDYVRSFRIVTATGATVKVITGLREVAHVNVSVKSAAGVIKLYNGAILTGGGLVYLDASGSNDIASGDIVAVEALGLR